VSSPIEGSGFLLKLVAQKLSSALQNSVGTAGACLEAHACKNEKAHASPHIPFCRHCWVAVRQ
jgi:hypothetical protein